MHNRKLAEAFGITESAISKVLCWPEGKKAWKHIKNLEQNVKFAGLTPLGSPLTGGSTYGTIIARRVIYKVTQYDNLYAQIVNNPKDVNFKDLDKFLKRSGFKCRQPGKGSSHYTYYHEELPDILPIPKARPIKAVYVKRAIELIEKLKERRTK